MKRRVIALSVFSISLPFLGLTGSAQAQQSCDFPVGTFDQVYCVNKVTLQADAEMNVAYQKLLKKLTAAQQQTLRQTQRAWMAKRDRDCVDGYTVYVNCTHDMTVSRLNFLNDRLRECNSSGCQPSKLR
ncbi:DUF1311 domain-containing protein [Deinococcus cavernae]|uniref:DUF1311 domain-containing protein n=1 Tax=Deinococcus cavernae TaxID=2320857 RepID=A0A418V6T8_9DEIO|nr:lysozyme inhibitor LprI family protein [Deinococcus cavernae]RJF71780.1 DUF1311 domain-containing protein [Deinococcus cavernae]